MENVFLLLGIAIIAASFIGYFSRLFKQPLVLAYIITGFLLGPAVFGLISDEDPVLLLSEMGITFLLFTVGLHLDLDNLKELGLVSLITGIGQVAVLGLSGFVISTYFGFSPLSSFYIGVSLAFSSTIIIVKMLSEHNDLSSLHGRISVGFLLVQDFLAILALVMVAGMQGGKGLVTGLSVTLLKAALLIIAVSVFTIYLLKPIFDRLAKNQELLFMSSISYCFLLAIASDFMGLSIEIGAFLAGLSLGTLPYHIQIDHKIEPLRDFFVVIFFITLGTEMSFSLTGELVAPLIALSFLVLVGTPLIILILMGALGYKKKTSFLTGLTVAQISEFSLVLVALGKEVGHIGSEVVSLVTGVGVITITVSAYMIKYSHKIYYHLQGYLGFFERETELEIDHSEQDFEDHIIVVGYHRVGFGIVNKLAEMDQETLVVDFDPDIIKHLREKGIPCIYGDIGDPQVIEEVDLEKAEMVISTAPDMEDNLQLMKKAKEVNPSIIVIIVAEQVEDALELYDEGADYVVLPHLLGGEHASLLLEDMTEDVDNLIEKKLEHIDELRERQEIHPHHGHSQRGI